MLRIDYKKADMAELDEIILLIRGAVRRMELNGIHQWDDIYPSGEDLMADIRKNELYVGKLRDDIAVVFALNRECDAQYGNGAWRYAGEDYRVIHRLCVAPVFQNRGIARMTLRYIEDKLKSQGIRAIRLDVFSENPYAMKLYSDAGYAEVGQAAWRKGKFLLMEKLIY